MSKQKSMEDKLDDLAMSLVGYGWSAYRSQDPHGFADFIKSEVSALLKEEKKDFATLLIGEDEKLNMGGNKEHVDAYNISFDRNKLRSEQRKRAGI